MRSEEEGICQLVSDLLHLHLWAVSQQQADNLQAIVLLVGLEGVHEGVAPCCVYLLHLPVRAVLEQELHCSCTAAPS